MERFIAGIFGLLVLMGLLIAVHATPHGCTEGVWNWSQIGGVAGVVCFIVFIGVLIGYGIRELTERNR